jgi:hypothetical protein
MTKIFCLQLQRLIDCSARMDNRNCRAAATVFHQYRDAGAGKGRSRSTVGRETCCHTNN